MESFEKPGSTEELKQKKELLVYLGARMHTTNTEYEDGAPQHAFPLYTPNQTNSGTSLPGEVSGGFSRQETIRKLYEKAHESNKEMIVLVTGGNDQTGRPQSKEAVRRLVQIEGLGAEDVVSLSGENGSTLGNVNETFTYIDAHTEELGDISEIKIVTNDFHMLRTWIMFSEKALELSNNETLQVRQEDKDAIYKILDEGTPEEATEYNSALTAAVREEVMQILQKYFVDSKVKIIPVVVEDVLDEGTDAEQRYARMLRNNQWVTQTLQFEYKGIKDLLEGRYKRK